MSRAEDFIQNYTRNCSNVVDYSGMIEGGNFRYHEWLTPDQARRAVEIAREEIIEKAYKAYCKTCKMPNCKGNECRFIENFTKYIKEE